MSLQGYILSSLGIKGKCLRTLTGMKLLPKTYLELSHFGHCKRWPLSFQHRTHPFRQVWIVLNGSPSRSINRRASYLFFSNAFDRGKISSLKNESNLSMKELLTLWRCARFINTRTLVRMESFDPGYIDIEVPSCVLTTLPCLCQNNFFVHLVCLRSHLGGRQNPWASFSLVVDCLEPFSSKSLEVESIIHRGLCRIVFLSMGIWRWRWGGW